MVLRQAPFQSIKEEEWMEMHERLNEVTKKIGVKKAGQRVVGLGEVGWRKTSKESFFSTKVEQERAIDRRSVLRECLLSRCVKTELWK